MANEFGSDRMWGLEELPLPDPVSWQPQTVGWFVLIILVLGLLAWFGYRGSVAWKRDRYRRDALARLTVMEKEGSELECLPLLLRRTALAAFPREEVAGLRGEKWIAWLNSVGGQFESNDANRLDRLAYDSEAAARLSNESAGHLITASRAFVRSHRARL